MVSEIVLLDSVPVDVRQLFETAKNLSLYSWFVYPFHQVAELVSFIAVETALRDRYQAGGFVNEKSSNKRPPSLYDLLQHAKRERWITNEGFTDAFQMVRDFARFKETAKKTNQNEIDSDSTATLDELIEANSTVMRDGMDRIAAIVASAHSIRNDLAHGSNTLHPNSVCTLQINAQLINQLYR